MSVTATLERFHAPSADPGTVHAIIERDGAAILDGLLSVDIVARVSDEFGATLDAAGPGVALFNPSSKIVRRISSSDAVEGQRFFGVRPATLGTLARGERRALGLPPSSSQPISAGLREPRSSGRVERIGPILGCDAPIFRPRLSAGHTPPLFTDYGRHRTAGQASHQPLPRLL
jgi:hypothetical protein